MSKPIKITQDVKESIKHEFDNYLETTKFPDGKINFSKALSFIQRKATVYCTKLAWYKMQGLVNSFDKEVAWHGVAYRGDDETADEYFITDIMVYPQEVTGATVTTDQKKYQDWLMGHDDDIFNNIRFQGHSHVNMAVSPSSVDMTLYESILGQLTKDMFYIFFILNKKGDKTIKIYDFKKNILFDTADCEVKVLSEDVSGITIQGVTPEEEKIMIDSLVTARYKKIVASFIEESKKLVTEQRRFPTYDYYNSALSSEKGGKAKYKGEKQAKNYYGNYDYYDDYDSFYGRNYYR